MWSVILSLLLSIVGLFLILIILLQRGRGGGLAGAFGGLGGQSAFGTKAGDVFTRITIGVAVVWVALAGGTGIAMWRESEGRYTGGEDVEAALETTDEQQAEDTASPPPDAREQQEEAASSKPADNATDDNPDSEGGPALTPPKTEDK